MIGAPQIILIIAVVLLLFGGRKIPELMKKLWFLKKKRYNLKCQKNGLLI